MTDGNRLYAVIGSPVQHSLSPAIHNAWFTDLGLAGRYVAMETTAATPAIIQSIREANLAGANITIPHKATILGHLDAVDPVAQTIGAVNTIIRQENTLLGYNTDAYGLAMAAEEAGVSPNGRHVVILGAGGAAAAAAYWVREHHPASITVLNRTPTRTNALKSRLSLPSNPITSAPLTGHAFRSATPDYVINTIPAAGRAAVSGLPVSQLSADTVWHDLNYWDDSPPHQASLSARGCTFISGHSMLLHQAAQAFFLFTGHRPSLSVGRKALMDAQIR